MERKSATGLPIHPAATAFPEMDAASFEKFKEDIRKKGLKYPIELLDGCILEGRHRDWACGELGIVPETKTLPPGTDPFEHVWSANGERRHMDESQRAMTAARLANLRLGDNQHVREGPQICGPSETPISQAKAAAMVNVSERLVQKAARVLKHGAPELVQAVDAGQVSVEKAQSLASLPKGEQPAAVKEAAERPPARRAAPKPSEEPKTAASPRDEATAKANGVAIQRANEAIDCLSRIPRDNPFRKRGFQIVADWIKNTN